MIEEQLRAIVAKIAETKPDFALDAHLKDDIGVDSVRAFEVVFEIEKELGVAIPEGRFAEIATFKDLLAIVQSVQKG